MNIRRTSCWRSGVRLLTGLLVAHEDYRMTSHQNVSGLLIKTRACSMPSVPMQPWYCSDGVWHTTSSQKHMPHLASLPHHPLPPWWKWENNVTSADRFIKTQKTLQKPFDIIISNAVRERCRLAIIIESNWSKKKKRRRKGEHSYKAVKLIIWSTGVFRDLDSLPLMVSASPARMISCQQATPLLWGSCKAQWRQNSVFTKVSLWPITLPCWFNSWDSPIALSCWHFRHQFSRTNNPDKNNLGVWNATQGHKAKASFIQIEFKCLQSLY